jgi:RNA 2',3'-cyclic 3'-phosphodiesterase
MNTKQTTQWRMFYAVELPEEFKARFAEHVAGLREAVPDVKASWERPEKIHVTVKFVGDVEAGRVGALSEAAGRVAAQAEPFDLTVGGTGAFHTQGNPRVLWVGVEDESGELARVHGRLEDECSALGFPRETRPFHPHLTVARLRAAAGAKQLGALHRATPFESASFRVTELVLMRSELGPGGSQYTAISRHPFEHARD